MSKRNYFSALIFFIFAIPSLAFGEQKVYFAGEGEVQQINMLIKEFAASSTRFTSVAFNRLPEITPESAQERFGITWLESSLTIRYPALVIAEMRSAGHALFAFDPIRKGTLVAEYTGEVITDQETFQNNPYVLDAYNAEAGEAFRKIDAQHVGNAARFALYLPTTRELLAGYEFQREPQNGVATANVEIVLRGGRAFLQATREIAPFEQIGFNFLSSDDGSPLPLFDRRGNMIPVGDYTIRRVLVIRNQEDVEQRRDPVRVAYFPVNAGLTQFFEGDPVVEEGHMMLPADDAQGVLAGYYAPHVDVLRDVLRTGNRRRITHITARFFAAEEELNSLTRRAAGVLRDALAIVASHGAPSGS
jgi:hypothetical protein